MSAFSYAHGFNIGNPSLHFEANHSMIHHSPSTTTAQTVERSHVFPADVDVLLANELVISISAAKDRMKLSSLEVSKSASGIHLK